MKTTYVKPEINHKMKKPYIKPEIKDRNINVRLCVNYISKYTEKMPGNREAVVQGPFDEQQHNAIGFDNTWGSGDSGL